MTKKDTLNQLIDEGELLLVNAVNKSFLVKKATLANYMTGAQYPAEYKDILIIDKEKGTLWKNKCSTYLNYQLLSETEKEKFEGYFSYSSILGLDISKESSQQALSYLKSLYEHYPFEEIILLEHNDNKRIEKIFISHATKDGDYIKLFVELLNKLGIKDKCSIFCSSIDDYGIPNGKNIYEHIKEEFDNNVFVLFFLSNNYYRSAACLNEMGATWIKSNKSQSILLPNFEFGDMRGAIDTNSISFKINDVARLNHFKDELTGIFNLTVPGSNYWEIARNKFIEDLQVLIERDKKKPIEMTIEKVKKAGDKIEVYMRTLNITNTPIEILEIELKLIDKNGNTYESTLELNNYIFPNENRVDMQTVKVDSSEFNGNRVDLENSKIEVHI